MVIFFYALSYLYPHSDQLAIYSKSITSPSAFDIYYFCLLSYIFFWWEVLLLSVSSLCRYLPLLSGWFWNFYLFSIHSGTCRDEIIFTNLKHLLCFLKLNICFLSNSEKFAFLISVNITSTFSNFIFYIPIADNLVCSSSFTFSFSFSSLCWFILNFNFKLSFRFGCLILCFHMSNCPLIEYQWYTAIDLKIWVYIHRYKYRCRHWYFSRWLR